MAHDDCGTFSPGRPGDGVMIMNMRGWRPPPSYRLDERGAPARDDRDGNGRHRLTGREDVPRLRAMDATARCEGDGHYGCKGCIYFHIRGDR